jgi:hypothetical protein
MMMMMMTTVFLSKLFIHRQLKTAGRNMLFRNVDTNVYLLYGEILFGFCDAFIPILWPNYLLWNEYQRLSARWGLGIKAAVA